MGRFNTINDFLKTEEGKKALDEAAIKAANELEEDICDYNEFCMNFRFSVPPGHFPEFDEFCKMKRERKTNGTQTQASEGKCPPGTSSCPDGQEPGRENKASDK